MKSVKSSSLNPYAAAYIPLSRRNAALEEMIDYNLMEKDDPNKYVINMNQTTSLGSSSDDYNLKGKIIHGSNGSTSQSCSTIDDDRYNNDKETNMVEEFDMALTYLQMICPGISEESLTEVFLANKGDLEATVEMLRQLEMDIDDCCEHLPDSLDIGDVTEPGSSGGNETSVSEDQIAVASSSSSSSLGLGMEDSESKKP
ncbi:polyadenylate-binding protein-interacting protein 5-like [Impatiens glandulifera]|uniref:polyadenylate-binding protein-interacting protein 5-like n=1 Tax=Impatiens glandulifera TaxID=253017 RepID=UPI001FB088E8|nr:polyadenylate-binding protein-interacting protein 5-like [Impatiens glandulifera]